VRKSFRQTNWRQTRTVRRENASKPLSRRKMILGAFIADNPMCWVINISAYAGRLSAHALQEPGLQLHSTYRQNLMLQVFFQFVRTTNRRPPPTR
jgi:hypothetical protein